jgi:hypothetical protein
MHNPHRAGTVSPFFRGGRELFYVERDTNLLMAVNVQTEPVFRAGRPLALFRVVGSYDVMPDGKHFPCGTSAGTLHRNNLRNDHGLVRGSAAEGAGEELKVTATGGVESGRADGQLPCNRRLGEGAIRIAPVKSRSSRSASEWDSPG